MLEIQKKQLGNIEAMLKGMGAKFAIMLDDGTIIDGGLRIKAYQPQLPGMPTKPRRDFSQFRIRERLAELRVGEVVEFDTAGTEFSASDVCGNLSSAGIYKFGNGNFTTCTVGTKVQGLRVA